MVIVWSPSLSVRAPVSVSVSVSAATNPTPSLVVPTVTSPHQRSPVSSVQVVSAVSSLVMVTFAVASEIAAFVAFDSVTVKVSSSSTIASLTIPTVC